MLAGTGPRGGEGIGALPAWVAELFTRKYERQEDMWLPILFAPTETSQAAGRAYVERIVARADRDVPVSDQSIAAQGAALAAYGADKDPSYAHLKGLGLPVLVVNGSDDIVIPTINSYILQQFLPDAELILYPDANHGAHFQHHELFVRHARIFLDDPPIRSPEGPGVFRCPVRPETHSRKPATNGGIGEEGLPGCPAPGAHPGRNDQSGG